MMLQMIDAAPGLPAYIPQYLGRQGEGRYFGYVALQGLSNGYHEIAFSYDPRGLSEVGRLAGRTLERRVGFVVAD